MSPFHDVSTPVVRLQARRRAWDRGGWVVLAGVAVAALGVVMAIEYYPHRSVALPPAAADTDLTEPDQQEAVVDGIRQSRDHFVSSKKRIRIERYFPLKAGKYPAVLILYGGGGLHWSLRQLAHDYARRGYVALVPHYFDQTGIQVANPPTIDQNFVSWMGTLNGAIDYARGLPEVKPDRIGLVGWSLGGSLALEVAATNDHVTAVVGNVGGMAQEIIDRMKHMPPTLLLDGGRDPNYPVHLAQQLARVLRQKGVEVESVIYPDQGHMFSGEAANDAYKRTKAFFDKHLRDAPQKKPAP